MQLHDLSETPEVTPSKDGISHAVKEITAENQSFLSRLPRLTLEEKAELLSGSTFINSSAIPRLDIPAIKLVDSVNSVKGSEVHHGVPTAIFPSSTCYGATWNRELMEELGKSLANQAKLKSAQVILGPTINLHRDPRAGRNFECFSEDPLLSGQLAAAIVNGIQSCSVAACPKHFACNDSEFKRRQYDVTESPNSRTLRELYLAAFQELLRGSEPMALMASYNKVDGVYASENDFLKDILRDEWAYNGCLVSDWFATKSTANAINAGLDLEMPGPSVFRGQRLVDQVRSGQIEESAVDKCVSRVLTLLDDTRECHGNRPERSDIDENTNNLARRIASEGIVLLKNENKALPLDMRQVPKIAVIGVPAMNPTICGGGSASAPPQYIQRPLECLQNSHPAPSRVRYAHGVNTNRLVPVLSSKQTQAENGQQGFDIKYFDSDSQELVLSEFQKVPVVAMVRDLKPGLQEGRFRYELTTTLTPETTGHHTLATRSTGAFELYVDGNLVMSSAQRELSMEDFLFEPARLEQRVEVFMAASRPYSIRLVTQARVPREGDYEPNPHGTTLCFEEYVDERAQIFDAVSIAAASDVSIIFAGRNSEYESEGFDLQEISMPTPQARLIKAVAAVSKKTVLVLHCGNPIDVSGFVDDVDAVLNAHFPGQEGGQAITDIITGKTSPSGKLATTWPKTLDADHVPTAAHFPARWTEETGYTIQYAEGLNMGYRWPEFDSRARWSFGFGLSYTTFDYSALHVDDGLAVPFSNEINISLAVTNTGSFPGHEVIQVYITPSDSTSVYRPARELKGFTKVWILPGESERVTITLDRNHACSFWDESVNKWRLEPGTYGVRVGSLAATFEVKEGLTWSGR
ncbi:hypothetical protein ASPZODRAFT_99208 [Penicilliopsis zonata CBS 506.65]|uniref:beta-glucosidase n=1 Tax=Penicilliopsis zonata CBS 506.65 TaxID=1073090 RepID=A0A1L9SDY9_9EURO|nr:hypothetical protein ASPZODRAFT_99208 [Penicilliopsis zonata CBS 506.65]OJJ45297.1 hypothetical protein ASPZODRAFT_99208 [Penicilliopsis zonata CBS 506.65]